MITINKVDGTKIIDVANLEGSYCDRSIMGGSTLQLVVKSDKPIDIPLNSYVEYEARRYTLLYPASIKKQHTKEFDYTLLFHGEEELLSSCLIKDISGGVPYRVKFAITAKPIDFIRCIVDSLNEHYGGGWSVGNVIEATEQILAFSHEYCLGAISRVAEVFNTEFSVENKTVSLGKVSIMEDNPLPMSYGNGKGFRPGTGRHNDGKKSAIGKLYVEGGTRNIDYSTYGAQTLLLPKSATLQYNGRTYRTDEHGMYITCDNAVGTAEDSYDGSAVYPMREGTVSEVIEEADGYDFTDTSIPDTLNYNDYRIKGEKAVVVFQTGALTGREFALVQTKDKLTGYIHSERKFKLVSEEQDGYMMPGGNFVPKSGDKYAIFNITLPAEYLSNASQRLFEEAVRYFDTVINPPYIFSGEVDPIWAKKEWLRIGGYMQPGGHILFSDPQYHPEGSVIRVTGVRTLLDKPYAPQLTLTNAPAALSVSNALSKLEADKVIAERERRAQQRSQRQDYQQALEFIGMVEQAMEGLEGFTARIKPSVVETMAILMGSQATQFAFVQAINSMEAAPFAVNYDPATKRVTITKGIIRHQTIGITDMTANRPATDYRYWSIPEYLSPALSDDRASYYIYAKVDKDGETGNYLLSTTPIDFEGDPLSYHLLIGTLSSIVDGDRAYNKLYGYSLLSPGQMLTDLIRSQDGKSYWDLLLGEFRSKGTFIIGEEGNRLALIDGKLYIEGPIIKVADGEMTIEQALEEQERKRKEEREARLKAEEEARQARAELEKLLQSLKDSTTSDTSTLTELINKVNLTLDNLQEQVDGEVSNWFYPGSPSATKEPESEWTTDTIRTRHIGDTYTSTDTSGQYMGKSWRYTTNFTWVEIADTLISQALAMASKAKTVADGKSTTFLKQPTAYSIGDSWVLEVDRAVNGTTYEKGTILYSTQTSSVFVEAHWVNIVRYIGAKQLKESEAASKAAWEAYANAQAKLAEEQAIANADGKITAEEQARIDAVKKAVETAKAYAEAQDKLLEERQKAYADGVLTTAEQRAIEVAESKAKLAETTAKAYADGVLTEAEKKAIAEAEDAYSKAVAKAKEMDDNIQIGGVNLLPCTSFIGDVLSPKYWNSALNIHTDDIYPYVSISYNWNFKHLPVYLDTGTYTLSFKAKSHVEGVPGTARVTSELFNYISINTDDTWQHFSYTFDIENPTEVSFYFLESGNKKTAIRFAQIKLERGNIATDWSPAPEDFQEELKASEAASKAAWEAYAQSQAKLAEEKAIANADGKITDEEQARIDAVKKAVETAKAYAIAQDKLLEERQKAYADGVLTEAEQRAIEVAESKAKLAETNAKAYSDGVLTEAEKKAIAEAQKAYDDAVAKAKELDGQIQVGGRNFALNSLKRQENNYLFKWDLSGTLPAGNYTLSFMVEELADAGATNTAPQRYTIMPSASRTSVWDYVLQTTGSFDNKKGGRCVEHLTITKPFCALYILTTISWNWRRSMILSHIKLERGTVATDWSPAPEDVEARLQAGINEAKQATADLKNYTDGAFADGIISKAEAISIEKLKNGVNEAWSRAFGEYTRVYTNPALTGTPKTTLENTKISLAGAKDALISAITTAIADGKSTPTEKSAVDTAYADFNTKLQAFQSALKDAEKAINDAQMDAERQAREAEEAKLRDEAKAAYEASIRAMGIDRVHLMYGEWSADITYPYNDKEAAMVMYKGVPYMLKAACPKGTAPAGGGATDKYWRALDKFELMYAKYINAVEFECGDMRMVDASAASAEVPSGVTPRDFFVFEQKNEQGEIHRYLQLGGYAKTEAELVSASTNTLTFRIADKSFGKAGTHIVDEFRSKEGNREVRFNGTLTVNAYAEANIVYDQYGGRDWYTPSQVTAEAYLLLTIKNSAGSVKYTTNTTTISAKAYAKGTQNEVSDKVELREDLLHDHRSTSYEFNISAPGYNVAAGDTVKLEVIVSQYGTSGSVSASTSNVLNYLPEDKNKSILTIARDKISFFFNRQKYILLNYVSDLVIKVVGNAMVEGQLQVNGGLSVNGTVDAAGYAIAGGEVNDRYSVSMSFGKYKNKSGTSVPQVAKLGSGTSCYIRVYHSIGNSNYVPLVTPAKVPYSDQPSIIDKQAYYFDVRFYNGSSQSYHYPFNYVCFKAD